MPFTPPPVEIEGTHRFREKLVNDLIDCYENEENTDFTIVTRDASEIQCHRFVLLNQSVMIKKLISLMEPPKNRLVIDNFPASVVESLVEHCYQCQMYIPREELHDTMVAVDYLQLDNLKELLSENLHSFLNPRNLLKWRSTAERGNNPRVAMEVKSMIVKQFGEFSVTDQIFHFDAVEIGKFMMEFNIEPVKKDLLVEATLRWMKYESNSDALDWLTTEQLAAYVALFSSNWTLECDDDTPEAIKTRTYSTRNCVQGPNIQTKIKELKDRIHDTFSMRMDRQKAEKIAEIRARKHLQNPPRDTKYSLSAAFNIFKQAVKKDCEKKGDEIDDKTIEEKYDILMGNRRFRLAIGSRVLELIQMKKCDIDILNGLVAPQKPVQFSRLVAESDEVGRVIRNAIMHIEKRQAKQEHWKKSSPLRLACVGGSTRNKGQNDECFMSYNGENFMVFLSLPDEFSKWTSCHCQIPRGFMATGESACMLFDKLDHVYDQAPPCPVQRRWFAMTYHEGRVYTISGITGEWGWRSTAQYYDMEEKQWHKLPNAPTDYMTDPSAVGLGKFIYVFSKSEHLCTLNIETHEWKELKKMPDAVLGTVCCTDGKRIWVAGGVDRRCYVYDPETDEWERKAAPLFQHEYPGLCFHMGLMFLVGGKDCEFVEEYDPETNEWIESTMKLHEPLQRCTAMQMPMKEPHIREDTYPILREDARLEHADPSEESFHRNRRRQHHRPERHF